MAGLDDERLTSIYVWQPKAVAELIVQAAGTCT